MADRVRKIVPRGPTAAQWREAAAFALQNPHETPDACRRRHDYCIAQAEALERVDGQHDGDHNVNGR